MFTNSVKCKSMHMYIIGLTAKAAYLQHNSGMTWPKFYCQSFKKKSNS